MPEFTPTRSVTIRAEDLKAGMTLVIGERSLPIDRARLDAERITVDTRGVHLSIDRNEEVEVEAVDGRPRFTRAPAVL